MKGLRMREGIQEVFEWVWHPFLPMSGDEVKKELKLWGLIVLLK